MALVAHGGLFRLKLHLFPFSAWYTSGKAAYKTLSPVAPKFTKRPSKPVPKQPQAVQNHTPKKYAPSTKNGFTSPRESPSFRKPTQQYQNNNFDEGGRVATNQRFTSNKSGWSPTKKLARSQMDTLRLLAKEHPLEYSTERLSREFGISLEAVRRILRSKFVPQDDASNDTTLTEMPQQNSPPQHKQSFRSETNRQFQQHEREELNKPYKASILQPKEVPAPPYKAPIYNPRKREDRQDHSEKYENFRAINATIQNRRDEALFPSDIFQDHREPQVARSSTSAKSSRIGRRLYAYGRTRR